MKKEKVLGFIRHCLTFGGGYLVGQGWIDESMLVEGIAAVMTFVGLVWSYIEKNSREEPETVKAETKSGGTTLSSFSLPAVLVGALLLSACAYTTEGQLTEEEQGQMEIDHRIYAAQRDYYRLLKPFRDYAVQPPCSETVIVACSDDRVIEFALPLFIKADKALDEAWIIFDNGGSPEGKLGAARSTISTLSAYLVAKGIVEGASQ